MKPVRNSAKALIFDDDNRLLCIRKRDELGHYLILPGGGQEPGETLHDALRRECREEISAEVEIGELRFVREYIGRNHEFADDDADVHQMDFMFLCSLRPGTQIGPGSLPDSGQLEIVWAPVDELVDARLYPVALSYALMSNSWDEEPVYLGDIN
jgi:8-oxo-dGTP diphosphatase